MCGIVGILTRKGPPPQRERLQRMCAALAYRGPDDEGIFVSAPHPGTGVSVGLGHRRLSILDPSSAGHQPMQGPEGRSSLVFNGEIFNFQALRDEQVSRGHAFRSGTDTEVLLSLYDALGLDALPRLNGMFAFALWDERAGRAFLVRDRFGVKPLYYLEQDGEVLFASELRGILAGLAEAPPIDPEAVDLFLTLGFVPAPWSIYQGIRKLPAGHVLTLDQSGASIRPWYSLPVRDQAMLPAAEAREALFRELDDAVRLRMISDRPLGSFLSGGLDSSIVTALAARHTSHPLETFSVTFQGEAMYDEGHYARAVARHVGTRHHEIPLSARDVLEAIPSVLDSQDEPFADASAVPTWLLAREARRSIVVALSGDGADELFAGYRKYQGELLQRYYFALPAPFRQAVIEPLARRLPESRGSRWLEGPRRIRRFLDGADPDTASRLLGWMTLFRPEDLREVARAGVSPERARALLLPRLRERVGAVADPINQALYVDVGLCLPDQMLVKVDRMSMRHGLEVRTPFLDVRVVELAFQIAGTDKLRPGQGKQIVLDTFKSMLPEELHRRPKRGFDLPLANWFRGPLEPFVQDLLSSEAVRNQPWIDPEGVRGLLEAHRARRRDNTPRLWTALSFLWWVRRTSGGKAWQ